MTSSWFLHRHGGNSPKSFCLTNLRLIIPEYLHGDMECDYSNVLVRAPPNAAAMFPVLKTVSEFCIPVMGLAFGLSVYHVTSLLLPLSRGTRGLFPGGTKPNLKF